MRVGSSAFAVASRAAAEYHPSRLVQRHGREGSVTVAGWLSAGYAATVNQRDVWRFSGHELPPGQSQDLRRRALVG
jgi:hypothetical protein